MPNKIALYKPEMCEWKPDGKGGCLNKCGLIYEVHAEPHEIELRDKINEMINKLNETGGDDNDE